MRVGHAFAAVSQNAEIWFLVDGAGDEGGDLREGFVAAFSGDRVLTWLVASVAGICFLGSCALHYVAVRNLKELLE